MIHVPDRARQRYGYPEVVIHRVKRIAPDGLVTTQGDARKEVDPFTVPREALTTRVITHIPSGGQIFGYFTSPLGLIWLAAALACSSAVPLVERHRSARAPARTATTRSTRPCRPPRAPRRCSPRPSPTSPPRSSAPSRTRSLRRPPRSP